MSAVFNGMRNGFRVPTRRHSGGEQCFHFRRKIELFVVEGIEQRLDAKAVADGHHRPVALVPNDDGKFTAQAMQELHAKIFIEMESDFAVGSSAQAMTGLFQLLLDRFVAVEFAVDDDPRLLVFAGDWLIAGCKVNDAEPRVTERDPAIRRNPVALTVGAAMIQALRGLLHHVCGNRTTAREHCDNSTHEFPLLCQDLWFFPTTAAR